MKESELEAKVVKYCHENRLLCYKFSSPSHRGVPDRLIMGSGLCMFLELKREGEEPTELQARELDRLNAQGIYSTWTDNLQSAIEKISDFFAAGIR